MECLHRHRRRTILLTVLAPQLLPPDQHHVLITPNPHRSAEPNPYPSQPHQNAIPHTSNPCPSHQNDQINHLYHPHHQRRGHQDQNHYGTPITQTHHRVLQARYHHESLLLESPVGEGRRSTGVSQPASQPASQTETNRQAHLHTHICTYACARM